MMDIEGFDQLTMNWRSALIGLTMACSMITLATLARRGIESAAIFWFAAFVLAANISAVPLLIGFAGAYDIWPGLTFLPTQTTLMLGPAIALHARALMVREPDRRLLCLFAPGIAYWLYQLWAFTLLGEYQAKWAFNDTVHEPIVWPIALIASWALMVGCLVYIWRLRARYLDWLKDNHSDDDRFSPVWLTHLVILVACAGLFWVIESGVSLWFEFDYFEAFVWEFVALLAIFVITLEALATIDRPFPKMSVLNASETDSAVAGDRAERDWVLEGTRLKAAVLENKWYLEPGLTLQSLSRRFGMNQVYLSRAINQGLGLNFSTFINGLRVDHAKALIARGDGSIIDIALASGFGSKASFNRAFKLSMGISPTEYRYERSRHETSQIMKN